MTDAELARIVGPMIATDLNPTQRATIETAITETADGVARIAAEVIADPAVRAPAPTLCARIERGRHLRFKRRTNAAHHAQMDTARRLYAAKLTATGDATIALDYAIEHALRLHPGPMTTDEVETDLRLEVGAPPLPPPASAEHTRGWLELLATATNRIGELPHDHHPHHQPSTPTTPLPSGLT